MSKKKVDIISLDNKAVSKEVKKELFEVDKRFVKIKPQLSKDNSILILNGRVYKILDNQFGMYADTGEIFKI